MNMKTIRLDISSDIFDKVISFLQMLPKNKVRVQLNNDSEKKSLKSFDPREFFAVGHSSKLEIDNDLKESKNSWNNTLDIR